jgi:hypothetical protein
MRIVRSATTYDKLERSLLSQNRPMGHTVQNRQPSDRGNGEAIRFRSASKENLLSLLHEISKQFAMAFTLNLCSKFSTFLSLHPCKHTITSNSMRNRVAHLAIFHIRFDNSLNNFSDRRENLVGIRCCILGLRGNADRIL